jgi:hypothetical protein
VEEIMLKVSPNRGTKSMDTQAHFEDPITSNLEQICQLMATEHLQTPNLININQQSQVETALNRLNQSR